MKMRAYVLIETTPGKSKAVLPKVMGLDGVKSADVVTGPYDIIAIVECEDLNNIGDLITAKLDRIDGVQRTVTCLSLKTA